MTLAAQNAAPSTLADVIGQVIDAFAEIGDATPIMVGKHYVSSGLGQAPRIVFVPELRGTIGPPTELGYACSITHSCDVYVRGEETGDDVQRFRSAYALGDLVIDCIKVAGGNFEGEQYRDNSPTDVDVFGAELAISFKFTRNVEHSAARWSLPAATADVSTKRVGVPPGVPGQIDSFDVTTTPKEP